MESSIISRLAQAAGNIRRIEPAAFASESFAVTECGEEATITYARLRSEEKLPIQAFKVAFGPFFSGEHEDFQRAAESFERTKCYASLFARHA